MFLALTNRWTRHFADKLSPASCHTFCLTDKYKLAPNHMQSYINDFDISYTVPRFTYMNLPSECERKLLLPFLCSGSHTLYNILLESS